MTTRKQAMQWWNGFEASTRQSLCLDHYKNRQFDTLTGSEIEKIFRKENKTTEENIYLNRLKEEFIKTKTPYNGLQQTRYNSIRAFCLDTQLLSFNEIEVMESEVNSVF